MWQKIVERKGQSVLISSLFYNGIQTRFFQKALGFPFGLDKYLIVDYANFFDQKEAQRFKEAVAKKLGETDFAFLRSSFTKFYRLGGDLIEFSESVSSEKTLPEETSLELFKEFSVKCLEFGPAMYFPILAEETVEEEIKQIIQKHGAAVEEYFQLFTSSDRPTMGSFELLNVHKIALRVQQKVSTFEINELIRAHLGKWGWLSYTKFVGNPWTEQTIQKRAEELAKDFGLFEKTRALETQYKKNRQQTKEAIERLGLSPVEAKKIWLAKELAFFRTYRLDIYTSAGYDLQPVFRILAQKLGISVQDFVFLTYDEIIRLCEQNAKAPMETIQKRKSAPWQLMFDHGKMEFKYTDFEVSSLESQETKEFRGQTAYPGRASGKVKIIRGVLEFHKMQKDDILVTSMTTPDFVPLMQKAKAIITDEGGITCHAAIVSRELRVPCIVGTKIATQVLKDATL